MKMKSKTLMMSIIGIALLVVGIVGATYSFFNYTRTGSSNTIKTGRIIFNHTQGESINLTNMFPIDVTNEIPNDPTKVGEVVINVTGDTTYTEGIEYLVTAVNVTNTVGSGQNAKELPISIDVTVEDIDNNDSVTTLGTSDEDYFTHRGANASTSIYKVLAGESINENDQLLVGYIKSGATGVDGNIVVKAYLDSSKVVISDTYPAEVTDTNNDGYIDGTEASFGDGKTVFTTDEWNSLQTNGVSFQVKVEAREGIWISKPVGTATFDIGSVVNTKLKLLYSGDEYTGQNKVNDDADVIYNFTRTYVTPDITNFTNTNIISSSTSEEIIYAWRDENLDLFWYTDATDVYLNQDSSYMFALFISLNYVNTGLETLNTSNVTNMSNMFVSSKYIDFTKLSNWNVSNVTTMEKMFYNVLERWNQNKDVSAINNWNVANVTNFTNMFWLPEECGQPSDFIYPIFTARLGTWDNTVIQDEWGLSNYAGTYVPNQ